MNHKLGIVLLFITFFSFSAAAATLERVLRTSGSPPHRPYHHQQGSSTGVKYGSGYGSYYHPRAKCPKLSAPVGGKVNVTGQYLGHKAIYSCKKGYVLVGFHIRLCIGNGTWSGMAPICKRVNCGPLPHIANGAVSIDPDTRLGSTATYTCNSGYKLVGEDTRTCLASGKWSGEEPVCSPVDCGDLDNPTNGWVHISPNTLLGGQALYRCKLGYELSSEDDVRTCQTSGQWSGSAPTCNPIDCGDQPTSDPNGQIQSTEGTSLRDKTTYSCNTGYFLVGSATIYCQNDKTYSDDAPTCQRIDCGDLPDIANGEVSIAPDTMLGSNATYSCDDGYTLQGSSMRMCQADGEWSGSQPTCAPVDCGDLDNPTNGWVHISPNTLLGSVALYRCKLGYELSSDDKRTCQTSSHWSGSAPTCDPIDCGPQPTPDPNGEIESTEGTSLRDKTVYACNPGYTLEGSKTIYCQNDGTYSDKAPTCQRIDCGDLSDIVNGEVSIAPDTMLGSNATYSCDDGYTLEGGSVRTCQASGQWSGSEPTCTPVDCGDLDNPTNGWVHIAPNTLLGGQALYRCKLGYQLSSDVVRTCQTSGHWSGSAPTCNPIDCGDQPTSDPNGQIQSTQGTSLRDKTTYSCNTGYFLVGSPTIYCQNDGTYSDDAPKCEPIDCGAPDPADPNGSMHFTTTTLGSRVVYSCNAGYTLVGHPVSVCQANGKYSSEAPICQPIDCGTLKKPTNGGVTFYPGTTFSSTASFQCRPGFKLVGSSTRSCMADGEWSGMQPVCQKIQCPKLKPPRFGKIYTSGRHPGAYVVYHCSYGYRLTASRRRVCLHTGHWSGSDRDCVKSDHYGGYYGGPAKSHGSYYDD